MGRIKIPVVIVVFAISLTLLLLGQYFIFRPHTLSILETKFSNIPGVKTACVTSDTDGLSLDIELEDNPGLRASYSQILRLAKQVGIPPEGITIQDDRGPILSQALYDIHYSVAEGIATGEFHRMATIVQDELANHSVERYQIWVERECVYVEMHYGSEHLYQVFPRADFVKKRGSVG
ncbi:MAG: hypothetical protein GX354_12155 [Firmicutes bacterium]|jgi:hypothetical protein|nr:hypothetical protein [Bacillota bacterium]